MTLQTFDLFPRPLHGEDIAVLMLQNFQFRVFLQVTGFFVLPDHEIGIPVQFLLHDLLHVQIIIPGLFVKIEEVGIAIEARLPGKREQQLSMLSGGERSLTANAFIF